MHSFCVITDTKKMPLGKLSKVQIAKGFEVSHPAVVMYSNKKFSTKIIRDAMTVAIKGTDTR